MSSILQDIEAQIAGISAGVEKTNTGTVRKVGDGVAIVEGLSDVMLNEMIEFDGGVTGMALNLEESEVGVVLLGDYAAVTQGAAYRSRLHGPKTQRHDTEAAVGQEYFPGVLQTVGRHLDLADGLLCHDPGAHDPRTQREGG